MVSFKEFLGVEEFYRFIFDTNNFCNLSCEWCVANWGEPFTVSPEEVELFCKRFKGIADNNQDDHRLAGGETTMLNIPLTEQIVSILRKYNRKVSLLTNGYGILKFPHSLLQQFWLIVLDEHGVNHELIAECVDLLNDLSLKYEVRDKRIHWDIYQACTQPRGGCYTWMRSVTLSQGVFFPCCDLPALWRFRKLRKVPKVLRKVGWCLGNREVAETIRNWRETVPKYVRWVCENKCWLPHRRECRYAKITLKPGDVIRK